MLASDIVYRVLFTRLAYHALRSHLPRNESEWAAVAGLVAVGACVRIAEKAGAALVNRAQQRIRERGLRAAKRD